MGFYPCFESGTFPEELKLAKVIPIFKSGDKQDISNYRPISILSFFSKVFEKTMYNHLINFIDANKILYKYQFGFRKSHSTNHAIISLAEKVSNAMDSGKISIGVFLDLRKPTGGFGQYFQLCSPKYRYTHKTPCECRPQFSRCIIGISLSHPLVRMANTRVHELGPSS